MSVAVRQFKLNGKYLLDIASPNANLVLQRLGFVVDGGNYIVPAPFNDPYRLGGRLPVRLAEWPTMLMEEYLDDSGSPKRFVAFEYPETINSHYGKYLFRYTPHYYGELRLGSHKRVYEYYLEAKIISLMDWLRFPFKTSITWPSMNESGGPEPDGLVMQRDYDIVGHFRSQQESLRKLVGKVLNGDSHDLDALEGYVESVFAGAPQHSISPAKPLPDGSEEPETFYVKDWRGMIYFELLNDVRHRIKLVRCEQCGGLLRLGRGSDSDRKFHTRSEDPDCKKQQDAARQARYRRSHKK